MPNVTRHSTSAKQVASETSKQKIVKTVYNTRFLLILWQYVSNLLIPDHQADAFRFIPTANKSVGDQTVDHLLGGFLRWDAQHFMHIAKYGYTYEHTIAFFPLYPLVGGLLSRALSYILTFLSLESIILVVLISLNIVFFKYATLMLYKLTKELFSEDVAYKSAVLFCYNPASVFFIAPYTEALFSLLSFSVMYLCVKIYQKNLSGGFVLLSVCVALSLATRSNGLLNVGFFWYLVICLWLTGRSKTFHSIVTLVQWTLVQVTPFVLYTAYCRNLFCSGFIEVSQEVKNQALAEGYVLPGQSQELCVNSVLPYSYVQAHYWNVGFLKYFTLKQLPNFFLALPIVSIISVTSLQHFLKVGIFQLFSMERKPTLKDLNQPQLNVFYAHGLALSLFCFFCINVQVSTRMLCSSSPLLYWICASKCSAGFPSFRNRQIGFISAYFMGYFFIGTLMFCNFLPWT